MSLLKINTCEILLRECKDKLETIQTRLENISGDENKDEKIKKNKVFVEDLSLFLDNFSWKLELFLDRNKER